MKILLSFLLLLNISTHGSTVNELSYKEQVIIYSSQIQSIANQLPSKLVTSQTDACNDVEILMSIIDSLKYNEALQATFVQQSPQVFTKCNLSKDSIELLEILCRGKILETEIAQATYVASKIFNIMK